MIDGLNRRSTVAEVLQKLTKQLDLDRQTEWVIIEVSLAPNTLFPQNKTLTKLI